MASITITTTAPQDTRITAAWTARFGTAPTGPDIKAFLIEPLRQMVLDYERQQIVAQAAAPSSFDPS